MPGGHHHRVQRPAVNNLPNAKSTMRVENEQIRSLPQYLSDGHTRFPRIYRTTHVNPSLVHVYYTIVQESWTLHGRAIATIRMLVLIPSISLVLVIIGVTVPWTNFLKPNTPIIQCHGCMHNSIDQGAQKTHTNQTGCKNDTLGTVTNYSYIRLFSLWTLLYCRMKFSARVNQFVIWLYCVRASQIP